MEFTGDQLERYARHIVLKEVGGAGQKRLLESKVLVVGAGGLGSPLLAYLAAAGVGTLGIADFDMVSLSNLQRQIIHTTADIGRLKTDSAFEMLGAINPDVKVAPHAEKLTRDNAAAIIAPYDLVADGCDNFATRLLISDACVALKKPLVSAAVRGFEGQIGTFKPYAAPDYPCYRCFVPMAPPEEGESCADIGILGAVAGVMGSLQATEVLKELLDLGEGLAGKLLLYDALGGRFRTISLPRDPACASCRDENE